MNKPKVNYDTQRQQALAAMRERAIKEAAAKKLADEKAEKDAIRAQNIISDAKTD